jgi:hypothetical protein
LHGKQFRVGFGQSWVHTRLEGGEGGAAAAAGLVSLATILQRPDPEVLFSIQNWLQVSNNGFTLIRITKLGPILRSLPDPNVSYEVDIIAVNPEAFFPASGSGPPNPDPNLSELCCPMAKNLNRRRAFWSFYHNHMPNGMFVLSFLPDSVIFFLANVMQG